MNHMSSSSRSRNHANKALAGEAPSEALRVRRQTKARRAFEPPFDPPYTLIGDDRGSHDPSKGGRAHPRSAEGTTKTS